jgi:hypothetical protein
MDSDNLGKPQFVLPLARTKRMDNIVLSFKGFQCCYRGWRDVRPCLVREYLRSITLTGGLTDKISAVGLKRAGIDVTLFESTVGDSILKYNKSCSNHFSVKVW